MSNRLAIAFFYDEHEHIDDYIPYLLGAMRPHVAKLIFVVNGKIDAASTDLVAPIADEIIQRNNVGFDVHAYKTGLETVGYEHLCDFDEVLMFNHTFYGPLYPFGEVFAKMDATNVDFWGISAHKQMVEHTASGPRVIPFHLNSHFIAVRRSLLRQKAFREYWENMRDIKSYWESIEFHELRFTKHFTDLGFTCGSYMDPDLFGSAYSAFMDMDETIKARSPILKRRAFFHDPMFLEERAVDLPRALRIVRESSDYPVELVWQNILRSTPARVLHANAALLRVFPEHGAAPTKPPRIGPIAVCVHAHYADMIDEILDRTANMPVPYDLIVTTDSADKKRHIEQAAARRSGIGKVIVRLLAQVRGRDMSSLLVTCADLFEKDDYALVCRLHTKKSPQVEASRGNYFKRFMYDNVVGSKDYIANIINLFEDDERLGIVAPPMFHVSAPTLGHAWFVNREKALKLAHELELTVPIDGQTPVATYGGMFWFRPKALRPLFGRFQYDDFEPEPLPVDGAMPHILERLLVYVAQNQGFYTLTAAVAHQIEHAYAMLEYKADTLASLLPTGSFRHQVELLKTMRPVLRTAFMEAASGDADGLLERLHLAESRIAQAQEERRREADRAAHMEQRLRNYSTGGGHSLQSVPFLAPIRSRVSVDEISAIRKYMRALCKLSPGLRGTPPSRGEIVEHTLVGYLDGRELFFLFDSGFYLASYPDVAKSGVNPLAHFIRHGWAEARSPHPLFDTKFVRKHQSRHASPADTPLAAFLADPSGDVSPHLLFNTGFYRRQLQDTPLKGRTPLQHYLEEGVELGLDPHWLFDTKFYVAENPELEQFRVNPLVHYIRYGGREGRPPSSAFNSSAYLRLNPDVRDAGWNPLVHYLGHGIYEGRPGGIEDEQLKRRILESELLTMTPPVNGSQAPASRRGGC